MIHGAVLFEFAHHRSDGRVLLADGDVDTLNAGTLLVDDGVDGDSGFTRLAVTDDQLALAASDRHHGVDGLEAGLHRFIDRFTFDNARRDFFDRRTEIGFNRPLAVDGHTQ